MDLLGANADLSSCLSRSVPVVTEMGRGACKREGLYRWGVGPSKDGAVVLGDYGAAIKRLTQIVVLPGSSTGVHSLPSHIV